MDTLKQLKERAYDKVTENKRLLEEMYRLYGIQEIQDAINSLSNVIADLRIDLEQLNQE